MKVMLLRSKLRGMHTGGDAVIRTPAGDLPIENVQVEGGVVVIIPKMVTMAITSDAFQLGNGSVEVPAAIRIVVDTSDACPVGK